VSSQKKGKGKTAFGGKQSLATADGAMRELYQQRGKVDLLPFAAATTRASAGAKATT